MLFFEKILFEEVFIGNAVLRSFSKDVFFVKATQLSRIFGFILKSLGQDQFASDLLVVRPIHAPSSSHSRKEGVDRRNWRQAMDASGLPLLE